MIRLMKDTRTDNPEYRRYGLVCADCFSEKCRVVAKEN